MSRLSLAVVLAVSTQVLASAATIFVVTGAGTWSSTTPVSEWTAPSGTWQFSADISLSPLSGSLGCGSPAGPPSSNAFDVYFCNFTYLLNGIEVPTSPSFVGFYSSASGGGLLLDDFEGQNNGFVLVPGTQLFTGSPASPTISVGTFDAGAANFDFVDGTRTDIGSGTVTIGGAPEPASVTLIVTAALLMFLSSKKGGRKKCFPSDHCGKTGQATR